MADEFLMDNPRADRVKRVAALASRAGRRKQGLFLAEGPQPVREALALWLRRWEHHGAEVSTAEHHDHGIPAAGGADAAPAGPSTVTLAALPETDALYFDQQALERHPDVLALVDRVRGVLFDPERSLPRTARIFLREATPEVLTAMGDAETSQGMIAVCRIPQSDPGQLETLLVGAQSQRVHTGEGPARRLGAPELHKPIQRAVMLLRVQDPGNAGTIIRTADAAGAGAVVLSGGSVDPWSPKVVRSGAGSHFHVPVFPGVDPAWCAGFARDQQMQVLAADGAGEVSLPELESLSVPTLWLLGNEAQGLSAQEQALADRRVRIPLYGQAESLNVATAATVCLYSSAMAQREVPR